MAKALPWSRYDHMDFPDYKFREYPKSIPIPGGFKIVHDQREELNVRTEANEDVTDLPHPLVVERDALAKALVAAEDAKLVSENANKDLMERLAKLEAAQASAQAGKVNPTPTKA